MSTILIVEDNAESRYMLERLLASKGHHIIAAENGEKALRLARQDPPEVIISDIMMPVMNGFRLCREVKNDPRLRNIPFIFYTAIFVDKADEQMAMSLGASRFVVKPTEGEAFLQILDDVLKEHQQGILPVPEGPLEGEDILLEMYDASITRKLAKTVERLQDERKALIRSERRLKEAQQLAHIGHWELDLKTDSLEWSDEIYRILGLKPQEFDASYKALLARELIHPDDRADVAGAHKASLSKKTPSDIEYRLLLKDGSVKYVNERFQTLYEDDGMPSCSMGTVQDITERKRTEEALRESEERYKTLFEEALDGICIADATTGVIIDCNQALAALAGRERAELIGQPQAILHPPNDDQDPLSRTFRQHLTDEEGRTIEAQVVTRNGTIREVEIKANRLNLGGKKALQGVFRDITERKQGEEALREAESRYRLHFDNVSDVIYSIDRELKLVNISPSVERVLGYKPEELIGRPFQDLDVLAPESLAQAASDTIRILGGERIASAEYHFIARDGTKMWGEVSGAPLIRDGQIVALVSVARDITERKEAEKALKEANDIINKSSSVAFTWKNQEGWPVEFVSENVERLFGYTAEEFMTGKVNYAGCVHPEDLERVAKEVAQFSSGKETKDFDHEPYRIIARDGSEKIVNDWSYVVRDSDGRITHYKGIVEDITESKRAEEDREKLQAQLNQAQKMESVGRLAGGVAHDFNNMLSVIQGRTELALLDVDPKDPLHASLQEISKAAKRSANVIRQLLAFARKQTIAPEVLHLNDTVEGMLKMLRRLIGEDMDLTWEPDTNLWLVNMDPAQIDQILVNLCVNARDAISGVGRVTIETENVVLDEAYCGEYKGCAPGEYVMLGVSDDGSGMDKETLENVFEPFFTTKEVGKGTGLGLSTVYGIVSQNQGFIDVTSEPGKGTTFKIYLRRHRGEAEEEIEAAKTEMPQGRGETILIVEDEALVLDVGKQILERLGYTVLATVSPGEAVRMAREYSGEIHLLMTDVVLPEMSGKDLAEEMIKIRPNTKTLFMSGYTADIIAHRGILDRGVYFVQKPFTTDSLARKVREVLDIEN